MSTVDSYLKALLALSGNEQLVTPRQHLLQGIDDDDLSELLKKAVGREFARGGLEDIVTVILDVIARDHATASVKNEQVQGNSIQQQSMNEIMVINDHPASGGPATSAMSTASKRSPSPSPGIATRKRSRLDTPPVVATQAGASAGNMSLRDCKMEQIIDNKIVPRIDIVRWSVHYNIYGDANMSTLFDSKFDEDYLSTDLHRSEWGKLLRLREKGVATQSCVNDTVIMRAKQPGGRTGHMNEACDRCIRVKRLCTRLMLHKGVIKLAFVPLPLEFRGDARGNSLDYWVRP
ncbi:hypothetical protein BKA58DRAFT_49146 [Alternaria rosae]|uniref:uncharacterized protein n=1 Tax=Alternaria rosae TaxID=1187941 RepID=UPI001E8E2950|nr:uncharacterized protein BKA58DRAFT_49146 [Alternaria rosae]KAH6858837.1 hypothetical protein BKA58DRAFT_49146 [Alternaria rosae]